MQPSDNSDGQDAEGPLCSSHSLSSGSPEVPTMRVMQLPDQCLSHPLHVDMLLSLPPSLPEQSSLPVPDSTQCLALGIEATSFGDVFLPRDWMLCPSTLSQLQGLTQHSATVT